MAAQRDDLGLHLHVPLKERTDLSAEGAVQGELFASDDAEDVKRGYRGTVASKVAGITYRQLDYWARKQIVEPSITPSHGSGSRRLYSFKDVVILAVSKRLLDAGVNLQNVTAAIGFLSRRTTRQLADVTIMCDGQHVYECVTSEQMLELLQSGKAVFGVSVTDYDRSSLILESVKTESENDDILKYYKKHFLSRMEAVRGGAVAVESVSRSDR